MIANPSRVWKLWNFINDKDSLSNHVVDAAVISAYLDSTWQVVNKFKDVIVKHFWTWELAWNTTDDPIKSEGEYRPGDINTSYPRDVRNERNEKTRRQTDHPWSCMILPETKSTNSNANINLINTPAVAGLALLQKPPAIDLRSNQNNKK